MSEEKIMIRKLGICIKLKTEKLTIQYFEGLICIVTIDKISENSRAYDHIFIKSK